MWAARLGLGLLLASGFVVFLLLENPTWEIWKHEDQSGTLRAAPAATSRITKKKNNNTSTSPLQSFTTRGYWSEALACSNIHRLSATVQCEGLLVGNRCGDVPLTPGLCTIPQRSKYVFDDDDDDDEVRAAMPSPCVDFNTSYDYSLGAFSTTGQYRLPSSSSACPLVDLNPRFLHRHYKSQRILFLGDSHARNLFTAFVAEVRNQMLAVERHVDTLTKDQLRPYQVFTFDASADLFEDHVGSFTNGTLIPTKLKPCVVGGDSSSGCSTVQVVYVWAATAEDYAKVLLGEDLRRTIRPRLIVTDFLSRAYSGSMGLEPSLQSVRTSFTTFLDNNEKVDAEIQLVIAPFAYYGGPQVVASVRDWLAASANKPWASRTLLLHQIQFLESLRRAGHGLGQLQMLSHSVCALYDTYSLLPSQQEQDEGGVKIAAHESCVAPTDRAVVRAAFTFALAAKRRATTTAT